MPKIIIRPCKHCLILWPFTHPLEYNIVYLHIHFIYQRILIIVYDNPILQDTVQVYNKLTIHHKMQVSEQMY